jgi:catechol 2,3-dioxygenase-like lactoylglutathione lyase family enzyme
MSFSFSGIQQIGIGVKNAEEAWKWYSENFGFDVPVFNDAAEAALMTQYTGGEVHKRQAILALNMFGGGGFEIWQFTSRTPNAASFKSELGDLGINAIKLKAPKGLKSWKAKIDKNGGKVLDAGTDGVFVEDPYGNMFYAETATEWFAEPSEAKVGGVAGAVIGVSNLEASIAFYTKGLGFTLENQLEETAFGNSFKKAKLTYKVTEGAFSPLLGSISIDLVERQNYEPRKIFENRYWGDLGFIHLCLDVNGMDELKDHLATENLKFSVDSGSSFAMEDAAGRFAYVEDPDGALIELVETHKVPLFKKLGLYLNIQGKRKPLARWKLSALKLKR